MVKKQLFIVGAILLTILLVDQATKIYIKTHFFPGETVSIFGDWFLLEYIENPGMAFGTTFGSKVWHKLALSMFRIAAIIGISIYWYNRCW